MFRVLCKFIGVWLAIQVAVITATGDARLAYASAGVAVTALGFLITPPRMFLASAITMFTIVPLYEAEFGFDLSSLIILPFFVLGGMFFFIAAMEDERKNVIHEVETPDLVPAMEQSSV